MTVNDTHIFIAGAYNDEVLERRAMFVNVDTWEFTKIQNMTQRM